MGASAVVSTHFSLIDAWKFGIKSKSSLSGHFFKRGNATNRQASRDLYLKTEIFCTGH